MTQFDSSTQVIPDAGDVPRHVAIIMDGNGRWAKKRFLPRVAGHRKGVEAVRETVKACAEAGVGYLTLFAFSSENWRRPPEEVSFLMQLFLRALEVEVEKLHANGIRFKVVGDLVPFDARLLGHITRGETLTRDNKGLTLTVAANYGGRWDILQAAERCRREDPNAPVTEDRLAKYLSMSYAPEPDLFIRTGGEQRVSNFLLWQLAYTELFFTDALWPDFGAATLEEAFESYRTRERRFGRTSEQLTEGDAVPRTG
ncbi:MAG: polyprenyl diphosphate synthase [Usitatibacter sp.]